MKPLRGKTEVKFEVKWMLLGFGLHCKSFSYPVTASCPQRISSYSSQLLKAFQLCLLHKIFRVLWDAAFRLCEIIIQKAYSRKDIRSKLKRYLSFWSYSISYFGGAGEDEPNWVPEAAENIGRNGTSSEAHRGQLDPLTESEDWIRLIHFRISYFGRLQKLKNLLKWSY